MEKTVDSNYLVEFAALLGAANMIADMKFLGSLDIVIEEVKSMDHSQSKYGPRVIEAILTDSQKIIKHMQDIKVLAINIQRVSSGAVKQE